MLSLLDINDKNFERDITGNLTKEGFLNLRNFITAFILEEFKPRKEELMNQRVNAFKEQDWANYGKFIGMAAQEY